MAFVVLVVLAGVSLAIKGLVDFALERRQKRAAQSRNVTAQSSPSSNLSESP